MIASLMWALTFAYMTVIYYLSDQSEMTADIPMDFGLDKILHGIEFGVLGILLYISLRVSFTLTVKKSMWLAIGFAVLYAVSDEVHQSFIPNRTASAADVLADSLGAVVFVFVIRFIKRK